MAEASDLDPKAVRRQFDRRVAQAARADFLLREIEQRMLERLEYVRLTPGRVLDVGTGLGQGAARLQQRFPDAQVVGVDLSARRLAKARQLQGAGAREGLATRLRGWFGGQSAAARRPVPGFCAADAGGLPLAASSLDLVWSNLAWPWFADPPAVIDEWMRVIRPGGLVMFSALGVDTLRGLQPAGVAPGGLPDMHDIGDALVQAGFADPVMDVEHLRVTWTDAQDLLSDLRALGGNPLRGRRRGLSVRASREALLARLDALRGEDGLIAADFEIIHGQAWCPPAKPLPEGYSRVEFVVNRRQSGA